MARDPHRSGDESGKSESWLLDEGVRLSALLRTHALAAGACAADAERAEAIARRAVPILLWKMREGEVFLTGRAAVELLRLSRFGVAVSACQRDDIPWPLRRALLPVLRPDCHESWVKWWDDVALESWAGAFLRAQPWAELASAGAPVPPAETP